MQDSFEFSKIREIVRQYQTNLKFRKKKFHSNYSDIFRLAYPELLPYILENTGFLDQQNPKMRARIACLLGNVHEIPKCVECGKDVNMSDIRPDEPIPKFCSHTCMLKSPVTSNARKRNKLEKYGDENWNNSEKRKRTITEKLKTEPDYYGRIDEKRKKTKLKRYGDENWTNARKSAETRDRIYERRGWSEKMRNAQLRIPYEKRKATAEARGETLKRKYAENPDLKNEVQEKSKKTRIERHGEDYSGREKCRNTMLERYGVRNAFQLEASKEKSKETCLRKYGAEYFQSTDGFVEKTTETCRERYGTDWFLQTDAFKENLRRNNLEKYGFEYSFQRPDVKMKIRTTSIERYRCEFPMQNPEIKAKAKRRYELVCLKLYGSPCYFTSSEYKAYCMEKFGVEHPMKNPEIRRKTRGKYEFDEALFDSAPELALYVWLTDMDVDFEYQPAVSFEYGYGGKTHTYFPDFRIGERYVEVKGPQFFGKDGQMLNPYRDPSWSDTEYQAECGKYEAKRICMLKNRIELLSEAGYGKYLGYAEKKYGRNFVKKFRRELTA